MIQTINKLDIEGIYINIIKTIETNLQQISESKSERL